MDTTKTKIMDSNDVLYLWQKIKTLLGAKTDKRDGYSLISDAEIIRLASVVNYDDTAVRALLTDLAGRVKDIEDHGPYDDTEIRQMIAAVEAKLTSAVHYRGTVETTADLPENPEVGDMYNVQTADPSMSLRAGDNVVWSGTKWDVQAGTIDTTNFITFDDILSVTEMEEIYQKVFNPESGG